MGRGQKQSCENSLGQTHILILQSLPENQGAIEPHFEDVDEGSTLWGTILGWCWCWEAPLVSPPSSFVVGGPSPTHQPEYPKLRKPQMRKIAGLEHNPTHQQPSYCKKPWISIHQGPSSHTRGRHRTRLPWSLALPMGRSAPQFGTWWPCHQRLTQCVDKNSQLSKDTNSFPNKSYAKYPLGVVFTIHACWDLFSKQKYEKNGNRSDKE